MIFNFILSILFIFLSIAFFTLQERKFMGMIHFRLGPNIVGVNGNFQPFSDAAKLFTKEYVKLKLLNMFLFTSSVMLGMLIMMINWMFYVNWSNMFFSKISILIYFCVLGLSSYFLLVSGWSSNSKYSLIGSYRSMSQTISYEIMIFILIILFMWVYSKMSVNMMVISNNNFMCMFVMLPCWVLMMLAELNRTPFDFSEGESELVSGFNTEYSGGMFSIIFISEYGMIIFMSFFTILLFFPNKLITMKLMLISSTIIWIRCTFPRIRYDKLLILSWKSIMPLVFYFLILLSNIF